LHFSSIYVSADALAVFHDREADVYCRILHGLLKIVCMCTAVLHGHVEKSFHPFNIIRGSRSYYTILCGRAACCR